MAREKAISAASDIEDAEGEIPRSPDEELPDDLALTVALQQMGDAAVEASAMVYQIDPKTGKDVFLYKCAVPEFAANGLNDIQGTYGAGDYRIRIYAPSRGLVTHRRISIGAPRVQSQPMVAPQAPIEQIMKNLLDQQMVTMMAGFRELTQSIASAKVSESMSVKDVLGMFVTLQGLVQKPQTDPLDMISKIVALQKDLMPITGGEGGDVGSGAIIMKAIDAFGKPLAEMMQKTSEQQKPVAAVPVLPNPIPDESPAAHSANGAGGYSMPIPQPIPHQPSELEMKINLIRGPIIVMAASNADPYPYASMLLDVFSPEEVAKYVTAENWQEQLYAVLPEARQYPEWFAKLREAVIEQLTPETE